MTTLSTWLHTVAVVFATAVVLVVVFAVWPPLRERLRILQYAVHGYFRTPKILSFEESMMYGVDSRLLETGELEASTFRDRWDVLPPERTLVERGGQQ